MLEKIWGYRLVEVVKSNGDDYAAIQSQCSSLGGIEFR